jgi:L-threonylcarbamoyladenylate synthase
MESELETITSPLRAAELLAAGKLVAFPTETVFGLGVDATNVAAVERLFAVKGRPSNNPLIVHIAGLDQLPLVAEQVPPLALELLRRFAPGPLTVVVPKHRSIVAAVTAGLDTVGVRIPDHPQALEMLAACHKPIAAPSANRSGKPSATTTRSVLEDFKEQIDGVLMSEPTRIGLESTVVDCLSYPPRVLRPGAVSLAKLQAVEPAFVMAGSTAQPGDNSPGRLHPHYRPQARVELFDQPIDLQPQRDAAYLGLVGHARTDAWGWHVAFDSIEQYAASFYESLREADRRGLAHIYCQRVPHTATGAALMDRLQRAAEPLEC